MACSTEKLLFINNSPILLSPLEKNSVSSPHPSEIAFFWTPLPSELPLPSVGRGRGGTYAGYFLELHIFFYSLCKEMKQQMEEQTTIFVQITYKSQQQVPRHMSVVPKHMADICTSEYLAITKC